MERLKGEVAAAEAAAAAASAAATQLQAAEATARSDVNVLNTALELLPYPT